MSDADVVRVQLPEQRLTVQRLGRHVLHDPRSRDYGAEAAAVIQSVEHSAVGLPFDQGELGSCTANALCAALNSAPNTGARAFDEDDAITLYELESKLEGQPCPPNDPGGSGLAVCKAAKQLGWVSSYRHAFGIEHALRALTLCPALTGINWYTSFDAPDQNGLVVIAPGATVRGGHEVLASGIDVPNRVVWFWNSWGTAYGLGGRFCMSFETWAQLLAERGDVTVPVASSGMTDDSPAVG